MVELQESSVRTRQRDRNSFILLQHLYTLSDSDRSLVFDTYRIGADLGFTRGTTADLVVHLAAAGCVHIGLGGTEISISTAGIRYLESAWRRRSVRIGGNAVGR